jgi:hypothetical protein
LHLPELDHERLTYPTPAATSALPVCTGKSCAAPRLVFIDHVEKWPEMETRCSCVIIGCLLLAGSAPGQQKKAAVIDPTKVDADFLVQGEYVGTVTENGKAQKYGVRVGISANLGEFKAVAFRGGLPGDGWDKKLTDEKNKRLAEWAGQTKDRATTFPKFLRGSAILRDGVFTINSAGETIGDLKRVVRKSPTLGVKPPSGAIALFDGSGLDHFVAKKTKMTDDKLLMVGARTRQDFRSFLLHLEFRVPYLRSPGHSAVFLQNSFHLAVAGRSFGSGVLSDLGCGGIRWVRAPDENMCFPPLTWQTFDVDYTAARFDETGKISKRPVVTVRHNGVVIHDRVELPEMPPFYRGGGTDPLSPQGGPLQFQSHADDRHYAYRNIWILERKEP